MQGTLLAPILLSKVGFANKSMAKIGDKLCALFKNAFFQYIQVDEFLCAAKLLKNYALTHYSH